MIKTINNFDNTYNILINIVNDTLYLDINNHITNIKFNLFFNTIDLKKIDINNIDILYQCLQNCFIKANNHNISFLESSNELIMDVSYIDEDYFENDFKLYLTCYKEYCEKNIETHNITIVSEKYEIDNTPDNDIPKNYLINIYDYFSDIVYLLKFLCIDDNSIEIV
jgi:hypothetical protein